MSKKRILVVDDDTRLRNLLGKFLQENDFEVQLAGDTSQARELLDGQDFDLLIVDVMMRGETGFEFTKSFRQENDTPIIILTARGDVDDRIEGLQSGAQDYLSKPFEPKELLLRIQNIIKSSSNASSEKAPEIYKFGDFSFNFNKKSLQKNTQFIHLTDSEKNILDILCRNSNKHLTREELAKKCGDLDPRSIDVQITRLRKKVEDNPKQPQYIQTVRNQGYILRD